ncbi:hypothetical protein DK37_08175 [Halomonas sp. SUBG004]|nr:hypothetical protein DK37_08175 [Halomonas sp. SUBG004]
MSQTVPESTLSHAALNGGLRGIAKRLVKHGLLTDAQATVAETTAAELEISLLQHVIDSGLVDADAAAVAAAWEYGLPVVDLEAIRVSALPPASDYPVKTRAAGYFASGSPWSPSDRRRALPGHIDTAR